MPNSAVTRLLKPADITAVGNLHAEVFGPGRFARSAYRVREGKGQWSRFCRLADTGSRIIAAVRITEIRIGGAGGAALLGPLAVAPDYTDRGYGRKLVSEALEDMKNAGIKLVVLVGDVPYYGRFGFKPVPMGQILFPAPVNPSRVLAAELDDGALARFRGVITAAPAAAAVEA